MNSQHTGCKPVAPRNIVIDIRGVGGLTPSFKVRWNACSERRHKVSMVVYEHSFQVLLKDIAEAADWPTYIFVWATSTESPGLCMDWPRRSAIR